MPYIKSLDGVRGIAVLLVVLFHFGFSPAGWIGVQIFFVLSGYLITSILLREKERPFGDYLGRFYWRRSLRIFPLYFTFLAVAALAYTSTGKPRSFATDWPFVLTYTANFERLQTTDIGPAFVHLWSLAVEEQFYLLWPAVVYFLSPAALKRVVIAILIASPMIRLGFYLAFQGQDSIWVGRNIYCLPISQFDAFASGASIVIWRLQENRNATRWFFVALVSTAICGAAVLAHEHLVYRAAVKWSFGYSMFLLPAWGFVWGYSLLNALSATIVISALRRLTILFEAAPLVRIGQVSYGIYVYHVPLLLMMSFLPLSRYALFPLYFATVYLVAELSFRYLESPFLRLKPLVQTLGTRGSLIRR